MSLIDPRGLQVFITQAPWWVNLVDWLGDNLGPTQNELVPPPNYPTPPDWTMDWRWAYPEGVLTEKENNSEPRWFEPCGNPDSPGEWRWSPGTNHHVPHWDYNPWNQPQSKWLNLDPNTFEQINPWIPSPINLTIPPIGPVNQVPFFNPGNAEPLESA